MTVWLAEVVSTLCSVRAKINNYHLRPLNNNSKYIVIIIVHGDLSNSGNWRAARHLRMTGHCSCAPKIIIYIFIAVRDAHNYRRPKHARKSWVFAFYV